MSNQPIRDAAIAACQSTGRLNDLTGELAGVVAGLGAYEVEGLPDDVRERIASMLHNLAGQMTTIVPLFEAFVAEARRVLPVNQLGPGDELPATLDQLQAGLTTLIGTAGIIRDGLEAIEQCPDAQQAVMLPGDQMDALRRDVERMSSTLWSWGNRLGGNAKQLGDCSED